MDTEENDCISIYKRGDLKNSANFLRFEFYFFTNVLATRASLRVYLYKKVKSFTVHVKNLSLKGVFKKFIVK